LARGKTYAREFKLDCVRQVASGEKRPAQICCEHYIAESMLLRWRKEYEALDEEAFTEVQLSRSEALERGSLS
jgi:putative transposase